MKRLTRFAPIVATTLLLAFSCGCGKFRSHKPAAPPPAAIGTKPNVDPRDIVTPGFQIKRNAPVKTNTIILADGTIYEGQFVNSKPHGQGHILGQNGTNQRGEWRYGQTYLVTGTWIASDGTKEVGTWNRDGSTCGGTIYYANGWKYVGDWLLTTGGVPDVPNGTGVMTSPDGVVQDGLWHQGTFIGPKP